MIHLMILNQNLFNTYFTISNPNIFNNGIIDAVNVITNPAPRPVDIFVYTPKYPKVNNILPNKNYNPINIANSLSFLFE